MQRTLRGVAAADGVALGFAAVLRDTDPQTTTTVGGGPDEEQRALRALALVAEDLRRWAAAAREEGRDDDAEILETSQLMAEDPVLREHVCELATEVSAEVAVGEATALHARTLEALPDPELSARGADVRELGRRAIRMLKRARLLSLPSRPTIVFARDIGPADVAEFRLVADRLLGVAIAEGAANSHAAIMTRALGLPFVVGLGPELLLVSDGDPVCLDGNEGLVVIDPDAAVREGAESSARIAGQRRRSLRVIRDVEPVTRDGRAIDLLCNANGIADVRAGIATGAQGVGLLRTELAFLESRAWPSESEHLSMLRAMLAPLADRRVTVRTLDFGHDKTPPFLAGTSRRGLELMLAQPQALADQLRAILSAGQHTRLRVLFPLVNSAAEFEAGAAILRETLDSVGWVGATPDVGAMIETPEAVEHAAEIAAAADFLALGTNDLAHYALEVDSRSERGSAQATADPRVLSLVSRTIEAAHAKGIPVEVCGEAAGEVAVVVLLVGLGVDELSVTPARLDLVRWIVSSLSAEDAAIAAQAALGVRSKREALALARALVPRSEGAEELREVRDGLGGVLP